MDSIAQRLLDSIRGQEFDFAVCVTDGELDFPGPRVLYVNDRFERLTGYTAAEIVGQSPRRLQGPRTDRAVLSRLKHTLQSGGFFRGQTVNYRKDGTEFLMAWSISPVGPAAADGPALYLAVQHDAAVSTVPEMMSEVFRCHLQVLGRIDPALETVQLLRDQIEYANSIVDTVRTPLLVLDAELRVKRANQQFYELFRLHPADTVGRPLLALAGGAWNLPELRTLLDEVLPERNPFDDYEMTAEFPGVGRKTLVLNARQLPLTGKRDMILLGLEDVTARRQFEAELMDRATLFVNMLAHELRNPMAPILTSIGLLRLASPGGPEWDRAVGTIERQVNLSNRLIEDLLDVSRVTRGKIALRRERLDLRTVIEQAAETAGPAMDAQRHQFQLALPWKPVPLVGDPTRLTQVFANLLQNAAKYTPPGGRVELTLEADPKAGRAVVKVIDSGVGIEPDMIGKVFDLFIQEDRSLARSAGGLGLGLTLVKSLVEQHGGTVAADSPGRNQGSTFTVTLPYQPAAAPAPPAPASPPHPPTPAPTAGRPLRVAVIDDNADAADTVALLLKAWGHTVATAYDGPAGLDLVRAEKPDVVLLDIGLPGLSGYEVAAAVKKGPGPAPLLVAVTGYGQEADRERAAWAGFDHHLLKPARPDDIARVLAAVGAD